MRAAFFVVVFGTLITSVSAEPPGTAEESRIRAEFSHRGLHVPESLDDAVLLRLSINPEGRVKVSRGEAGTIVAHKKPTLYLVRVENASGGRPRLRAIGAYAGGAKNPFTLALPAFRDGAAELSGAAVEYRLLEVTGTVSGRHELTVAIEAGQGSQDLGFRSEVPILFRVVDLSVGGR